MPSLPLPDSVLFVLLDGFRPDYLDRTRFLRGIAPRSLRGALEEPFGFCPRGAYFGGLSMAEQGFTHLYRYDPPRSPFAWTHELTGGEPVARPLDGVRDEILARARMALPPFGAGAVTLLDIPLEWLHYFDLAEQHAPWSRHAGYRSLFHACDDAGAGWLEVSWPFTDIGCEATDGLVTGHALGRLRDDHRFVYLHLPSLDALGHRHGPGGRATHEALQAQDRLCELIVDRAAALFDDPVVVFAGDHGMLPVVQMLDVATPLRETGLRYGHDLVYFVDSTMVRCWFFESSARARAMHALSSLGGGHWITDAERERWELTGIDTSNGEEYFLLDAGVVCAPSFFDWSGTATPRGMHGYAPDVEDNRGVLLVHRPTRRLSADIGAVAARRLYPTFARWLGLDAGACTAVPIVESDGAAASRWFLARDAADDVYVDAQITTAVADIRRASRGVSAIVLTGSAGRGEATPLETATDVRAVNDYDFVVVGGEPAALEGVGTRLSQALAIDFVDIEAVHGIAPRLAPSLADFDLRYGSRVVWGDPLVLDGMPTVAPADLDAVEAIYLLHNRLGGLLTALVEHPAIATVPIDAYRQRQVAKVLMAIGDAWLILAGDYSMSYRRRAARFAALASAAGFLPSTVDRVAAAYTFKLRGMPAAEQLVLPLQAVLDAVSEFRALVHWNADDREDQLIAAAVERHLRPSRPWLERVRASGLWLSPAPWPDAGAAVYRAVGETLRAWPLGASVVGRRARASLAHGFDGIQTLDDEHLAATVADLWLAFFH